jgi:hypothetical protein
MFEEAAKRFEKLAEDLQGVSNEIPVSGNGTTNTPLVPLNRLRKPKNIGLGDISQPSLSPREDGEKSQEVIDIEEEFKSVLKDL